MSRLKRGKREREFIPWAKPQAFSHADEVSITLDLHYRFFVEFLDHSK